VSIDLSFHLITMLYASSLEDGNRRIDEAALPRTWCGERVEKTLKMSGENSTNTHYIWGV